MPSPTALARVMSRHFISRQFSINVPVTYVWHEYRLARPFPVADGRENMRKIAIVALVVMAGMSAPVQFGVSYAQPAPGAAATSAMADKDAAMKTLADAEETVQDNAQTFVTRSACAGRSGWHRLSRSTA